MTRTVTFEVAGSEGTAAAELTRLGFVTTSPRSSNTTLLDTFDGRVHRAGLRLDLAESDQIELTLTGLDATPAHVTVEALPRVPSDLPPGPLRSRIAALIGERSLLPRLRVGAIRTEGALRDAAGKIVAVAELFERVLVADRADLTGCTSTLEIHEVQGYPKHADRVVRALGTAGFDRCTADTLTLCAAAAGVELAGVTATPSVPLDPEMAAIDGFRLVLANLATAIDANWQGTIEQTDTEFLHDLRIAVRRTRSVLAEAKQVLPPAVRDAARAEFAWLADLTSEPRDLDAYLLNWAGYTDPFGPSVAARLEPVRLLLEGRRADAHLRLEEGLCSERSTVLRQQWRTWLAEPVAAGDRPPRAERPLGKLIARRIARAHHVLLDRGRLIVPDTPATQVHDLRKDAKRLRYLIECFGSLVPPSARKKFVKRLKTLQDNLGEHQDADVHVHLLRAIADELHAAGSSTDTMLALGQLTERLDRQRQAARLEFAERFARYDTPATQRALDEMLDGITT